jgi:hypothetical protein
MNSLGRVNYCQSRKVLRGLARPTGNVYSSFSPLQTIPRWVKLLNEPISIVLVILAVATNNTPNFPQAVDVLGYL